MASVVKKVAGELKIHRSRLTVHPRTGQQRLLQNHCSTRSYKARLHLRRCLTARLPRAEEALRSPAGLLTEGYTSGIVPPLAGVLGFHWVLHTGVSHEQKTHRGRPHGSELERLREYEQHRT